MRTRAVLLAAVLSALAGCHSTIKTAPDPAPSTITNPLPSIPSSSENPTTVGTVR